MGQIKNIKLHIVTDIKVSVEDIVQTMPHCDGMGTTLKWLATISTGVYAGGNLYISTIEAPLRNKQTPKLNAQILQITQTASHRTWTSIMLFGTTCSLGGVILSRDKCSA